jgi:hypothetical protein
MKSYAAVSVTEFDGPKTDFAILSLHDSIEDARKAADKHDPDYDAKVDARRLRHNQTSPTRGEVMEVVTDNYDERDADEYESLGCVIVGDNDGDVYVLRDYAE